MKWTDIIEFDAVKGTGKLVVRVFSQDGIVGFEGNDELVRQLKGGVFSSTAMRGVMPEEGDAFLGALEEEYRSPYLFATAVREGNEPQPYEPPPLIKVPDKKID